jgi:hypothetical protein
MDMILKESPENGCLLKQGVKENVSSRKEATGV